LGGKIVFQGCPSFYDLWHDLRAATSEIRPDWDLSTPGLREAWDAGDYSHFHGLHATHPGCALGLALDDQARHFLPEVSIGALRRSSHE
jgi:hypothetical protein